MGERQRRMKIAKENGQPWPPPKEHGQAPLRKRWICGKCGNSVVQQDAPFLACRCGEKMWNCLATPKNPAPPAKTESEE